MKKLVSMLLILSVVLALSSAALAQTVNVKYEVAKYAELVSVPAEIVVNLSQPQDGKAEVATLSAPFYVRSNAAVVVTLGDMFPVVSGPSGDPWNQEAKTWHDTFEQIQYNANDAFNYTVQMESAEASKNDFNWPTAVQTLDFAQGQHALKLKAVGLWSKNPTYGNWWDLSAGTYSTQVEVTVAAAQ